MTEQTTGGPAPALIGKRRRTIAALFFIVLGFFGLGLLFLPLLGFEYDEVVFIQSLFHPAQSFFSVRVFHHAVPLMQMSYAGALKTWIYAPITRLYTPDAFSVRIPALLLAGIIIFLIGLIVRFCASSQAALFACAVLATDLNFLLTSVFDWGPVVVQNLLLVTGLYFLVVQRNKSFGVPLAAFAFGLALWDKALFLWIFSGLVLAGVAVGFRVLKRELTQQRVGLALVALLLGAAPLLFYNVKHNNQTLKGNARLSPEEIGPKFSFLRIAVNDGAFKNFFVDPALVKPPAKAGLVAPSSNVSSWRVPSFLFLSLAGLVLARPEKRRFILWLQLAAAVAWLQAAMTKDAGGFVHHVVIFYPVLFIALGVCADEIANRWRKFGSMFLLASGAFLCLTGLNVIRAQYVDFRRFSPSTFWTDADQALSQYLMTHKGRTVLIGDWGIAAQADVRTCGALPMQEISFSLRDGSLAGQQMRDWAKTRSLVVLHTPEHSMFPNQNGKLIAAVKAAGLGLVPVKTITDRGGHPMFEVSELVALSGADSAQRAAQPPR